MTILSWAKTLIKYAKCGMGLFQMFLRDATKPGFLYFPQKFDIMNFKTAGMVTLNGNIYIGSIKGRVTDFYAFGATNYCEGMTNLGEIVLPECARFYAPYGFKNCAKLHTVKLPAVSELKSAATFDSCTALKHLEVGRLQEMNNQFLLRCSNLEEFIPAQGTNCNLFLQYSKELTQDCLHTIIDNFADRTGQTALTLHIYDVCAQRISDEYKQKAADKNINILEVKSQ